MSLGDYFTNVAARATGKPHTTLLSSRMVRLSRSGRVIPTTAGQVVPITSYDQFVSFLRSKVNDQTLPITKNHVAALQPLKWFIDTIYGGGGKAALILTADRRAVKELVIGGIPNKDLKFKEGNLVGHVYTWDESRNAFV